MCPTLPKEPRRSSNSPSYWQLFPQGRCALKPNQRGSETEVDALAQQDVVVHCSKYTGDSSPQVSP